MKKVKRYSAGGYEDTDDYKNLVSAQEREDVEAIGDKFAKTMPKFEWMGKKYTTELASEKKQAPKQVAAPKTRPFAERQEAAGKKMQGAYRGAVENIKQGARSMMGFKSGGKVTRGDGIAQRGKTKGRMV
jgi:uncharacterized protein YdaU (DUF1376 family)